MADKKARQAHKVQKSKSAVQAGDVKIGKSVPEGKNPDYTFNAPIAWNFRRMDSGGRWPCGLADLHRYRERIVAFEGRTIKDIFLLGDRHSHPISVDRICETAKKRLDDLGIDHDTLYQLSLAQAERLWGILHHNIFHILWLDKDHSVCPTGK